ncbi:CHAP domain-containing protein [Candidatus Saccharibacteria bacterium]|nr:MAG: CHAP domain-containing protein [Candidatus Saccharibacteria bacterium]
MQKQTWGPKASTCLNVVLTLLAALLVSLITPISALAGGGYPDDDAVDCSAQYGIYSWCKGGSHLSARNYDYRNCTDWVAYRLESQAITNHVRGRGDGKGWDDSSTGVTITSTPEVGDAAVWNSGGDGHGHVAYVEEIRPKTGGGYEARVSEYNYAGTGMYTDARWVVAENYVDFNGVGTPVGGQSSGGSGRGTDTIGVYNPSLSTFDLRNSNTPGNHDITLAYGNLGATPVVGDWDGDGDDTIGVFNPNIATFDLRNSNTTGSHDITLAYGNVGWTPLVGDWDGDGDTTIGMYNPSTATFYLRNSNTTGVADITVQYGNTGALPVIGDWDGNGTDTIGTYYPSTAVFDLRNSNTGGNANISVQYGNSNMVPLAGDWDGNGTSTIGVYNPNTAVFDLRNSNTGGNANISVQYGNLGAKPVVGDWNNQ